MQISLWKVQDYENRRKKLSEAKLTDGIKCVTIAQARRIGNMWLEQQMGLVKDYATIFVRTDDDYCYPAFFWYNDTYILVEV